MMLIPSRAAAERSAATAGVERGKVWAALRATTSGRLRDVPTPGETRPGGEGPAVWIRWGAWNRGGNATGSPVELNRERELGLDRRETG